MIFIAFLCILYNNVKNMKFKIIILYISLAAGMLLSGCVGNPPDLSLGRIFDNDLDTGEIDPSIVLVINEIQITGADGNDEYIELYNPSATNPVIISTFRICRSSAGGGPVNLCIFNDPKYFHLGVLPASTVVQPLSYYLIVNAKASPGLLALADAMVRGGAIAGIDDAATTGYSGTDYMTLTDSNTVYLAVNTVSGPTDPDIIDFVGYGTAVEFIGSQAPNPTASLSWNKSIQRVGAGYNSFNNGNDFILCETPTPKAGWPVTATAPSVQGLALSGSWVVGYPVSCSYYYLDPDGNPESDSVFTWCRSATAGFTCDIGNTFLTGTGAAYKTYTLTSADDTYYVRFEVTPKTIVAPLSGTTAGYEIGKIFTDTGGLVDRLVINEVQIGTTAGGADDEFIELYNPTGSPINLQALPGPLPLRIQRISSAGAMPGDTVCIFSDATHFMGASLPHNMIVPAGGYYVIYNEFSTAINILNNKNSSFESDLLSPPLYWTNLGSSDFIAQKGGTPHPAAYHKTNIGYFQTLTSSLADREVVSDVFAIPASRFFTVNAYFRSSATIKPEYDIKVYYYTNSAGTIPASIASQSLGTQTSPATWTGKSFKRINTDIPADAQYARAAFNARYATGGSSVDKLYIDSVIVSSWQFAAVKSTRISLTASNAVLITKNTAPTLKTDPSIIDLVGWGLIAQNIYEGGSPASDVPVNMSIQRKWSFVNTHQDNDQNGYDFEILSTPTPGAK